VTILKYPKTATLNQDQILQHASTSLGFDPWMWSQRAQELFFCISGSVLGFMLTKKQHIGGCRGNYWVGKTGRRSLSLITEVVLKAEIYWKNMFCRMGIGWYWQLGHDDCHYSPRRMDSSLQGLLLKTWDIRPILQCHAQIGPSSKSRCLLRRL